MFPTQGSYPLDNLLLMGVLHEAVTALSLVQDIQGLWRDIVTNSRWLVTHERMCILERHDDAWQVTAETIRGTSRPVDDRQPFSCDLLATVSDARVARWLRAEVLADISSPEVREFLLASKAESFLAAPMRVKNHTLGILVYAVPNRLEETDLAMTACLGTIYAAYSGMCLSVLRLESHRGGADRKD